MVIYLSPEHGVNPSLDLCFVCGEATGVMLFGQMSMRVQKALGAEPGELRSDPEAPRTVVMSKEPCDNCKVLMEKGVVLVAVDESLTTDRDNPYRTGPLVVVTDDYIRRCVSSAELCDAILKRRMAFLPDETWDLFGLPRGAVGGGHP